LKSFLQNLLNGIYLIGLYGRFRSSSKIVLLDQGGVQALWSVFFSSTLDSEKKQKLAARLPDFLIAQYVIFPECSTELIISRLEKRPGKQSRIEKKSYLDEKIEKLQGDLELLQSELIRRNRDNCTKRIFALDNSNYTFLIDNAIIIAEKLIEEL